MANSYRDRFLCELQQRYGVPRKLNASNSLYEFANGGPILYLRYSKLHAKGGTFFGLRHDDLRRMQGRPSFIVFLTDGELPPLFLPFSEYEEVLLARPPASDGQYKVQLYPSVTGTQLYIARSGRFNVEGYLGWSEFEKSMSRDQLVVPQLSHSQVQTLLGAIGVTKGYDVWIPTYDRGLLDWTLASSFDCRSALPNEFDGIRHVLQEVDVLWFERGGSALRSLFEVEHSTAIYSGLLRFNDIHLSAPSIKTTFSIVANDARRALFTRQVDRPTFRASGLADLCSFLDYANVFDWHSRVVGSPLTSAIAT